MFEVHEGPSALLKQNPAYSPQQLHTHVFWVMTDCGVLDLLAYNEEAHVVWVKEIGKIAQGTPTTASHDTPGNANTPERSPGSRRAGEHALVVENEARDSATGTPALLRGWTDNSSILRPPHDETASELELRTSPGHSTSVPPSAAGSSGTASEMPTAAPQDSSFIDDII